MSHDSSAASPAPPTSDDLPTEEQVVAFLARHPDFLVQRPDVAKELAPPSRWTDDTVVDLQQFMVSTLREEMAGLRACTQEVIEVSRQNMTLQSRTHQAVLAVLAAGNLDRLLQTIADDVPVLLEVDIALIALEPSVPVHETPADHAIHALEDGDVEHLLAGQDVVLLDRLTDGGPLFSGASSLVRSAALARLIPSDGCPAGLFALGSREEDTFQPKQGGELLRFLAKAVELCLHRSFQHAS